MGNNQEIRKRMETCRSILLALNWVFAGALMIVGFVLQNSRYTEGIGVGVIIASVVIGIIGHFIVNVTLAIPFILLNNGDYLAAIVPEGKTIKSAVNSTVTASDLNVDTSSAGKVEDAYTVIANTAIRGRPEQDAFEKGTLNVGDTVYFQSVSEDDPKWFNVTTADSKNGGWCFAGHLKKS
jgi:hypothetical protein